MNKQCPKMTMIMLHTSLPMNKKEMTLKSSVLEAPKEYSSKTSKIELKVLTTNALNYIKSIKRLKTTKRYQTLGLTSKLLIKLNLMKVVGLHLASFFCMDMGNTRG